MFHVTGQLSLGGAFSDSPGPGFLNVGAGGAVNIIGRATLQNGSTITVNDGGALSLGSLADGPRGSRGSVQLARITMLSLTEGGTGFSGVIGGEGALEKSGAGVQTLFGANTYTGNTTVLAGTLRLSGNGSFAASRQINLASEAVLDVTGVTGGANFANDGFALAADQTLAGCGTVSGPLTIVTNAAISPGADEVGQLNLDDSIWNGGGRYLFDFNSLIPDPGTTSDFIQGAGALGITATAASPFIIDIRGVDFSSPGATQVDYTIATFTGGVNGFDPAAFVFPATGWYADTPAIALEGNSLVVSFIPAPEPASAALASFGVAALVLFRGWKKRRAT